jgi:hypothetical protein
MRVVFNADQHTYWLGDKRLISVTRLLKKHGLSTDYSAVNADVLEKAAKKGTAVHSEIEEYIKNGAVGFTPEFMGYLDLVDELQFIASKSEVVLPSNDIPDTEIDNYIIAGTADIIGASKDGITLIDIKTMQKVNMRSCAWQLSLYERLAGVKFDKMYIFHLREETSRAIPIERIPAAEIDRLLECERNGEIYHEPGLVVTGDLIACAEAAERELKLAEAAQKSAKETAEKYRQQLYELMEQQGIASWETLDKSMLVTRVAPSTKNTIDSAKLKADMPEVAEKYSKTSNIKGYVKITIRE